MTCIVGVAHDGTVYLGGDSASVAGYDLTLRRDAKVFHNGACLVGFTTSWRMGQLLRYAFTPPEQPDGMDDHRYLVTLWINAVRACLKEGGYARKDSEVESGGFFLVGYHGHLYRVDSDYQVGESQYGYDAVGCGESVAVGALAATESYPPLVRVNLALSIAERHSAGVRGPFTILNQAPVSQASLRQALPVPAPAPVPVATT